MSGRKFFDFSFFNQQNSPERVALLAPESLALV